VASFVGYLTYNICFRDQTILGQTRKVRD